ncbi:hypothetical protein FOA52_007901 [Chlamydomonas sp. UWO 241]|nr:hypothetical protein FOA52_007901 [Chlamydomonas sp. UWO 241]
MITKAAHSASMMKLASRLMDTPLESYQQAHGQLTAEERKEWEAGLGSANIGLSESDALSLHLLGRPAQSEPIAAALMAHELGAALAFVDCPAGRSMFEEFKLKLQEEEYVRQYMATCQSSVEAALGASLAASCRPWAESDPTDQLLQFAVWTAMIEAVGPDATPVYVGAYPKEQAEANAQRERGMCRNIIHLCSGQLILSKRKPVTPRKRVLVIVGRAHVAPLIELLEAA